MYGKGKGKERWWRICRSRAGQWFGLGCRGLEVASARIAPDLAPGPSRRWQPICAREEHRQAHSRPAITTLSRLRSLKQISRYECETAPVVFERACKWRCARPCRLSLPITPVVFTRSRTGSVTEIAIQEAASNTPLPIMQCNIKTNIPREVPYPVIITSKNPCCLTVQPSRTGGELASSTSRGANDNPRPRPLPPLVRSHQGTSWSCFASPTDKRETLTSHSPGRLRPRGRLLRRRRSVEEVVGNERLANCTREKLSRLLGHEDQEKATRSCLESSE